MAECGHEPQSLHTPMVAPASCWRYQPWQPMAPKMVEVSLERQPRSLKTCTIFRRTKLEEPKAEDKSICQKEDCLSSAWSSFSYNRIMRQFFSKLHKVIILPLVEILSLSYTTSRYKCGFKKQIVKGNSINRGNVVEYILDSSNWTGVCLPYSGKGFTKRNSKHINPKGKKLNRKGLLHLKCHSVQKH